MYQITLQLLNKQIAISRRNFAQLCYLNSRVKGWKVSFTIAASGFVSALAVTRRTPDPSLHLPPDKCSASRLRLIRNQSHHHDGICRAYRPLAVIADLSTIADSTNWIWCRLQVAPSAFAHSSIPGYNQRALKLGRQLPINSASNQVVSVQGWGTIVLLHGDLYRTSAAAAQAGARSTIDRRLDTANKTLMTTIGERSKTAGSRKLASRSTERTLHLFTFTGRFCARASMCS